MKPITLLLATTLAIVPAIADAKDGKHLKFKGHGHHAHAMKHGEMKRGRAHWRDEARLDRHDRWDREDRAERLALERELRREVERRRSDDRLGDVLAAGAVGGLLGGIVPGLLEDRRDIEPVQYREGQPQGRLIGRVVPGVGDVYFDERDAITRRDYDPVRPADPRYPYVDPYADRYRDDTGEYREQALEVPGWQLAPLTSPMPRRPAFARDGGIEVATLDPLPEEPLTTRPATGLRLNVGDVMPSDYRDTYVVLDDLERFGLPPNAAGTDYVRVDNDAVLVERNTGRVRDVMPLGTLMVR
ncbi:RcnB family protein [Oceaniglobus roseus]|uniref:RcnB family protein n=1 Tax=Oceaniglobus roseus TaxID=1737570 RepID=UPI000C7EDD08|nr:RcnB family protein [Kandeliimicrobium roseum]